MNTVDKKEHISADSIIETIGKMSAEEQQERILSLCRGINTLLEGISNLIDEEKELTCLFQIGFVGNLSAMGVPDMIHSEIGSVKGCERIKEAMRKDVHREG